MKYHRKLGMCVCYFVINHRPITDTFVLICSCCLSSPARPRRSAGCRLYFTRAITECYFSCTKTCDFDRCQASNTPFARSGHMVRNKLCWNANNAVELPKQRNSYPSSPTFLCFVSPTALFASQHNLIRTM